MVNICYPQLNKPLLTKNKNELLWLLWYFVQQGSLPDMLNIHIDAKCIDCFFGSLAKQSIPHEHPACLSGSSKMAALRSEIGGDPELRVGRAGPGGDELMKAINYWRMR